MGGAVSLLYAGATHAREQGKIDAARISQGGKNLLAGSNASYQQWAASFSNNRAMKAAGRQANSIMENIGKNLDAATYGRAMSRLAASEAVGADLARSAAAGVGGSSIEMFNQTAYLNTLMQEESEDRATRTDLMNASSSRAFAISDAVENQDNTIFQAGLDFTTYQNHKSNELSPLKAWLTFQTAAVATYFGGPQAGGAVVDFVDAQNRAANGDIDGAASRMTSAFQGAVSGVQGYTQRNNTPYGQDLWASTQRRRAAAGANLQIGGNGSMNLNRTPSPTAFRF